MANCKCNSQIEIDVLHEVIGRLNWLIQQTQHQPELLEQQEGLRWAIEEIENMLEEMEGFSCLNKNTIQ